MRVAIPVTQGRIPNHLGHCEEFWLADVDAGTIRGVAVVQNPGHGPGGPPPMFLRDQGVTHVLAWGMPPHARGLFKEFGVAFQLGVTGEPRRALEAWLSGDLVLSADALDAGGGCGGSPHDHEHHHRH